jgi:hypothetical protein
LDRLLFPQNYFVTILAGCSLIKYVTKKIADRVIIIWEPYFM